jgi:hypothetical protein
MRDVWKVLGGVAVGILAVTGVMAMDEEQSSFVEHDEQELDEPEDENEEGPLGDEKLIVRKS